MSKITSAQKRFLKNATLIAALRLIFQKLEESGVPLHRLREVADTTSGGTPSRRASTYYGGNIPWIKSGELNDGLIEQTEEFLTDEGLSNSSAKIYSKGTLVIALYGATVGKTGILGIDAASNQAVCAVTPKLDKVSTNFLFWFLRHKRQDFLNDSFGGAQPNISQKLLRDTCLPLPKKELQEKICEFLEVVEQRQNGEKELDLPVLPPPLEEQRSLVARIEELAGKIEEARSLRLQTVEETDLLFTRASSYILDSQEWEIKRLASVLAESPRNGLSPQQEVESNGRKMLRINAVSSSATRFVDLNAYKMLTVSDDLAQPYTLKNNDVFIVRYNGDINRVVKATIFKTANTSSDVVYPDKLMRLRADCEKILPDFLVYALGSQRLRSQIEKLAKTTAGQIGISGANAKSFQISVPPLEEQRRIVAYLDELQAKVDAMKLLRENAIAELDALLPSILDKAFKGELL